MGLGSMELSPFLFPQNAKAWLSQPGLIRSPKSSYPYFFLEEDEEDEELEEEDEDDELGVELEVEGLELEDELEELVVDAGRELVEELGAVRTVVGVAGGGEGRDGAGETLVVGRLVVEVDGVAVAGR